MPWDKNNLGFEEHSDVNKKLSHYANSGVSWRDRRNPQSSDTSAGPSSGMTPKPKRKVVLVTDDFYYNRKPVSEMLNRQNISTVDAINGQDAVAKVKNSFDNNSDFEVKLILMDLEMPIMGGIEAAVEIRRMEKAGERKERIPIVAVTAHSSARHRSECFKVGMQEHVVKPVSVQVLKDIIERFAACLL